MNTVAMLGTVDENSVAFKSWLEKCKAMIIEYYIRNYKNLSPAELTYEIGNRYIKVVKVDGSSRSAWAFVDKRTGDILKPASWKIPAKHARGNVFDITNGMNSMTAYGPAYLK